MKFTTSLTLILSVLSVTTTTTTNALSTTTSPPKKKGPPMIQSKSLPFMEVPATVFDGTMAGDVGFDPLQFATDESALKNYREAEIKHCRLAMLAAAGWPLSELFDQKLATMFHLSPLVDDANRVPSVLNGGLGKVSPAYWLLVVLAASAIDAYGLTIVNNKDYRPGDFGFDPMGLYTNKGDSWKKWMETAEIKNGRLAMIAITGFAGQEFVTSTGAIPAVF